MNTYWDISKYNFPISKEWFYNSELKHNILNILNPKEKLNILEIGSYEGCSSCFFSDFLLEHYDSKLICVDPFDENDAVTPVSNHTKNIFYSNILKSKNIQKVLIYENYSDDFYKIYKNEPFDFIYIDGAHTNEQIRKDLDNCFNLLKQNGIMWMDDFNNNWRQTFIEWLEINKEKIKIIHMQYQLGILKI